MSKFSKRNRPLFAIATMKKEERDFAEKRNRSLVHQGANNNDLLNVAILEGRAAGLTAFVASDGRAKRTFVRHMAKSLKRVFFADRSLQFAHVTFINDQFDTSDERTQLDLHQLRGQFRDLMVVAPNWLATIEFAAFQNRKHQDGGKVLSPHVHAVCWGHDILASFEKAAIAFNARYTTGVEGVDAVKVQAIRATWGDLKRVLAYPFRPPCRTKTVYHDPKTGRTNLHESEKGDRYIRFLRLFQLLSLIEQDRLTFASGDGVIIRRTGLAAVHSWLEARTERSARAPQLAWIRDMWADLIPRLKLTRFELPVFIL